MRILTVRQPWAGAIIWRDKDVENRTRNIAGDYRGSVAIHVALRFDYPAVPAHNAICGYLDEHSIYGHGTIIGVVDLVAVHHVTKSAHPDRVGVPLCWDGRTPSGELCSPWAESAYDGWHLELANPRPLAEPIPFKGALGLRRLPDDVAAAVIEAVAS